ncbi:MAG: DUF2336 domain-containing protein [Phyllobacteriaceae bacterium]|nr:DUF2336 domain-containing protein [Phyllobacteriaceae bacterium]
MVVDRFFTWVRDASVDQRLSVVAPMVGAFLEAREREDDRELCAAALTVLAGDPDVSVRAALAEGLVTTDEAPRHLLLDLLWDVPAVAAIVAGRCEALIEAELVEVAASAVPEVVLALAGRRRVGPGLAATLAETVDRCGAVLLVSGDADLTVATQLRLVDRFGEYADLREAFASRPHVPVTVRHRILEKLAETMGNLVVLDHPGGEERGRALTRDAKDRATVALAAGANDAELTVLVDHLRRTGQLTTRLVLRAACVGALRVVEEAIALLARVPIRRVSALVADGREGALRALYARAGMPERAFPAFAAALEIHRELVEETGGCDGRPGDRARFARRLVERVLTRVDLPSRRDGDDLVALLRRFSADAARDQARAVAAERLRPTIPALAAPVAATEIAPVVDAVPEILVDPTRARFETEAVVPPLEDAIAEAVAAAVATARACDAAAPAAAEREDLDEPIGLFSHLRLEDVPPEWLADGDADEVAPAIPAAVATSFLRGGLAA